MIDFSDILDDAVREWYERHKQSQDEDEFPVNCFAYPSYLELESTSRCNINPPCPMCVRVNRTQDDEYDMPSHLVSWLANPINSAANISISGVGEPMMAKEFERMIGMASESTGVSFFSNANVLTDKNIKLILGRPIHHISFSLDAARSETYDKIRGYDNITFEHVIDNIRRLVDQKRERGLEFPVIHLIMVIMKENWQELIDFVHLAHSIGVQGVRYWKMRKPSYSSDYTDHDRNGFKFRYLEQSTIPPEFEETAKQAADLASKFGLTIVEE